MFNKILKTKSFWLIISTVLFLISNFQSLPVFADSSVALEVYGFKLGNFDYGNSSILIVTVIIALIDGFNPCAMTILIFLISLLLELKETWKRWYLGGVFLLTSGVSYYLFLASWLKVNEFIGLIPLTRSLIAMVAWIVGVWSLNQWWKERNKEVGCKVEKMKESRKFFSKITEVLHRQNLAWSTIGIIVLAFSVNLFELLCSAALPATYTNILAGSGIDGVLKYLYLGLYVLIFMIDDLIVFTIAMLTLQVTGMTSKFNHLTKLLSGIIMILLALWITIEVMQGLNII
jgi:hypothetical protein